MREHPSRERRLALRINVLSALFTRDAGNEGAARRPLASVAGRLAREAPLRRSLARPLVE